MDTTTLAAFLAMDLLLVFTPGADWAFAITAGLRDRSVVPAVAGLVAGYAVTRCSPWRVWQVDGRAGGHVQGAEQAGLRGDHRHGTSGARNSPIASMSQRPRWSANEERGNRR